MEGKRSPRAKTPLSGHECGRKATKMLCATDAVGGDLTAVSIIARRATMTEREVGRAESGSNVLPAGRVGTMMGER